LGVKRHGPTGVPRVPSGDGSRVAFSAYVNSSAATAQIYLRDLDHRTTRIIDTAPNGDPPDAGVHDPSISLDGRFVTFYGVPTNLGATPPGTACSEPARSAD
jgi:Tol biopolymer transport system component